MKLSTLLCVIALCITCVVCDTSDKDIIIKLVERDIDLTSQLVKMTSRITLENTGSSSIKSFTYLLSNKESASLAFLGATSGGSSELKSTKISGTEYRIHLKDSLNSGKSVIVDVEVVLQHALVPYPKSISQGEKQLVEYTGNYYFLSPYSVTTQTTAVFVTPNVISYSKLAPSSVLDTTITYGPYENVPPMSHDIMKIHYENNAPFLTITRLERLIELSHWGNIAIEETIDVLHTGALLKGSFSRYDYQREHNLFSSIKSFKTVLPASAKDVYYRDDIGNISTSNMKVQDDAVELELRPRFPLFGGWKTHYTVGYNVPSYEYLYSSGKNYILKMRFLDHIFDDMAVDEIIVRIILPEGVDNIKFKSPYEVERLADDLHFTYLDVMGRPVITLSKKYLVENHIQDFELHYTFAGYRMLFEPFLIAAAFFLMFFTVILYVRLDLTISKDEASEMKMRISSQCELVHTHHNNRVSYYERLEDEIQKLKTSKDVSHAQAATKKLFASIKEETNIINDLIAKVKPDSSEYAEKISDLQKHDKTLLECLQQQVGIVEKMVLGKMNKQSFIESNNNIHKKKETALEKVKASLASI